MKSLNHSVAPSKVSVNHSVKSSTQSASVGPHDVSGNSAYRNCSRDT